MLFCRPIFFTVIMNSFPKVDNPVSLLNQDTSRHLLQSKDESDLYKVW